MAEYMHSDSLIAEQHNTLVLLDQAVGQANLSMRPSFELLGGTAMAFHGVTAVFTVDIDCANKQTEIVKKIVEPFVSDMASTVVQLPTNYKERLVEYPNGDFENFDVYLLSIEDLVITKLDAWRVKDKEDLTKTSLLTSCDLSKVVSIINAEMPTARASTLLGRLASL